MRTQLTQIGVVGLLGLLLILGAGQASAEVMRWQVDGETREAIVYAPAASPEGDSVPLVLSFHGFGDNMQNFQHTDMHVAWPDAVVVYFQGLERRRGLAGWQVERDDGVNRDLRLVDVALASLRTTYDVDDDRIYVTGFSNGGMFTYLLWAERPGVFAAYAPVAGRLRDSVRPTQPRPLFHVAGERDRQVSFSDQEAAIEIAIDVNGVGATTTRCGDGCTVYGPDTPAPVMTWIHAGGHVYPRETSERIVSFFREHSRSR
jgi:polyhydroxybutyrate depolymerase